MTTHYHSASRGPVAIASMNYNHLLNARDKLARDADPTRATEVAAIAERIAALEVEHELEAKVSHG